MTKVPEQKQGETKTPNIRSKHTETPGVENFRCREMSEMQSGMCNEEETRRIEMNGRAEDNKQTIAKATFITEMMRWLSRIACAHGNIQIISAVTGNACSRGEGTATTETARVTGQTDMRVIAKLI